MDQKSQLSEEEICRYDRHLRLPGFGLDKQLALKNARVLVLGGGGLGCPVALYLAAAGVGKIAIADQDRVDLSNLQRQIAYSSNKVGALKAQALSERMIDLNEAIEVVAMPLYVGPDNVEAIVPEYDLVIDGSDNFETRFLLADACYLSKVAYLHASVYQYKGQVSLFVPGKSACFRCLFQTRPRSELAACSEVGVLGALTGIIGTLAATEAIKYITGLGNCITGQILTYDLLTGQYKKRVIEKDNECILCSDKAEIKSIGDEKAVAKNVCIKRLEINEQVISVEKAREILAKNDAAKSLLIDVREEHEFARGHLENAQPWPLSQWQEQSAEHINQQMIKRLNKAEEIAANNSLIILLYCQRGHRSLKAVSLLTQAGFNNVFSLEGGLDAWQSN